MGADPGPDNVTGTGDDQAVTVYYVPRTWPQFGQNIQRIVNDLHEEGLIAFEPNPHHKRAQLVVLTGKGQQIYDAVIGLYDPAVNALADGQSVEDIETARRVLLALRRKLEGDGNAEERA